jgi:hypothetical protein
MNELLALLIPTFNMFAIPFILFFRKRVFREPVYHFSICNFNAVIDKINNIEAVAPTSWALLKNQLPD